MFLSDEDKQLLAKFAEFHKTITEFVIFSFPWGQAGSELEAELGPDEWQFDILQDIDKGLLTADESIQIAVASGHGVGKSALIAWIILWTLATMTDSKGVVTANTDSQLRTKTWAELAKWYRMFIGKHFFDLQATSIASVLPEHEKIWRFDMLPWSVKNSEAFAGLHNKGKRIVLLMDEGSGIHDVIWEVSEGALTDKNTQKLWVVFGNPTRNTGRFKECFNKFRHRWIHKQVDSRTSKFTDKKKIKEWETDYGVDSDFFKVRVRGMFPNVSSLQFIPTDYVDKAYGKHIDESKYRSMPKVLVLDNAWTGEDATILAIRQGLAFRILAKVPRNEDDSVIAALVMKYEDEEDADAVFIDQGWGTGVYSFGKNLGRTWILVDFGGASTDTGFLNKRADMWNQAKAWLKDGGAIPADQELYDDLIGPEHRLNIKSQKIYLESKEDMKERGLPSPNKGDALALTFAFPVVRKDRSILPKKTNAQRHAEYDPLK